MQNSSILAYFGAGLHLLLAVGEMVPLKGKMPFILNSALRERGIDPNDEKQQPLLQLLKTVVFNAGGYNLILAFGFLWAACPIGLSFTSSPEMASPVLAFFSAAAVLAGVVGLTLSRKTVIQIAVGAAGLLLALK